MFHILTGDQKTFPLSTLSLCKRESTFCCFYFFHLGGYYERVGKSLTKKKNLKDQQHNGLIFVDFEYLCTFSLCVCKKKHRDGGQSDRP